MMFTSKDYVFTTSLAVSFVPYVIKVDANTEILVMLRHYFN